MAQRGARRDLGKERFWRRLLRLWRRSGQTIREFCAEHGVSEPSFFAWRRALAERVSEGDRRTRHAQHAMPASRSRAGGDSEPLPKTDVQPTFVPLRVVSAVLAAFEVVLHDGRVVRVPPHFDAVSLRQLLAILEEERTC